MANACSRRELRRLRKALGTMPVEVRAVFDRHRFGELGYAEIAAELGIAIVEVERRMAAAMLHLDHGSGRSRSGPLWAWLRATLRRICPR